MSLNRLFSQIRILFTHFGSRIEKLKTNKQIVKFDTKSMENPFKLIYCK